MPRSDTISRRFNIPINAFNGGELSPLLFGRYDLDKYESSVETMLNFIIQPEGGAKKRSGTRYVKPLQDSSVTARLIPFMYSTDTPYILEFGNLYIKVFHTEGPVLNTAENIEGISQANPAVVTITGHGFSNDEEVYIASVSGMTEVNGRYFTVANAGANTFELSGLDSSGYTAYTSGGTCASVYTITTTYTQSEVEEIEYAQSSDSLYLAHQSHAPAVLTRTAHTSWTLANVDFLDGPYLAENQERNDMDPSNYFGAITIDADNTTNINGGDGFNANDVGRFIRIREGNTGDRDTMSYWDYGHAVITDINSTTNVDADVVNWLNDQHTEVPEWRLGAFYIGNYPAAVSFGDGRLWWGGTPDYPGDVYGSYSGNFTSYAPSTWRDDVVTDASAVSYTIGVNNVNEIKWISCGKNIIIGTPGGVFPLMASSAAEPITPTNVNVPSPSLVRVAAIHPAVVGNTVVFINRAQTEVRAMRYSVRQDGFIAEDLTRLASHIGDSNLHHVSYAQDPDSALWVVRADGSLAALTYQPEEDVVAWSRHILGGSFGTGDAVVEKVAVVESPNGDHDQVWFLVKRTINGSTVRYIEFLEQEFSSSDDQEDAFFLDCGFTYDGTSTTTITGLWHLEGETVQILADGAPVPDTTVSNGQITLSTAASVVHVGYSYNSDIYSLRLDIPSAYGTSQGMLSRVNHVIIRLHRSSGGKYGPDSSTLSPIIYRVPSDLMDTPVPLFSGDIKLPMELKRDRDPRVFIRADQPLPFNILSMTPMGSAGDR